MTSHPSGRATLMAAALTSVSLCVLAPTPPAAAQARPLAAAPRVSAAVTAALTQPLAKAQLGAAPAIAIHVPRLRMNKRLIQLHVQSDRTLTVPKSFQDVGWWSEGPRPAAPGAVIVGGHISSKSGPGAFINLRAMRVGDLIGVDRADRTTAVFQVRRVASYSRTNYPNSIVYRTTGRASVHLITCDGSFDPAIGHHVNNLVVFADLVSTHRTR